MFSGVGCWDVRYLIVLSRTRYLTGLWPGGDRGGCCVVSGFLKEEWLMVSERVTPKPLSVSSVMWPQKNDVAIPPPHALLLANLGIEAVEPLLAPILCSTNM